MDKKVKGAWLLTHAKKLQASTSQDFDSIGFSGKCGTYLSAISACEQLQVSDSKLKALAQANSISYKTEVPAILSELARQKLILQGNGAIEVLALSGNTILEHTATIYEESDHQPHEDAVIVLSEMASEMPVTDKNAIEMLSDKMKVKASDLRQTLDVGEEIGFFDSERISKDEKLIFNGNLFRREDAKKIEAIIASLSSLESQKFLELTSRLQVSGCIAIEVAKQITGDILFSKLHSIGMFDVSIVGNDSGKSYFVTRPAAFSKFTKSIADDAFDLAKALVASLTYGMTVSSYYRGRIQAVSALVNKLVSGQRVGPATAIGNDYRMLEYKGVIQVTPAHGGMFYMKLLKPEVGRLALSVIQHGDITADCVNQLPGVGITNYVNPETTREHCRKHLADNLKLNTRNLLNEIRLGGIKG